MREPVPVFPQMGWSCVKCKRSFSFYQLKGGCPYCKPREFEKFIKERLS